MSSFFENTFKRSLFDGLCRGLYQRQNKVTLWTGEGSFFWPCWLGKGGEGIVQHLVRAQLRSLGREMSVQFLFPAVQAEVTLTIERTRRESDF